MVTVYARRGEDIEYLISRFKHAIDKDGKMNEIKENEFHRTPSLIKHERNMKLKYKKKMAKLRPELERKVL